MKYDETMKKCLESILNVELSGNAWNQSSLPVKNEGIGIRKATNLAFPAFISSARGTSTQVRAVFPDRF